MTAPTLAPPARPLADDPRPLSQARTGVDRSFRSIATIVGCSVLVLAVAIGGFLGYQLIPTLHHYGLSFLTGTVYNPDRNKVGIGSAITGTIEVAVIAIAVSFPIALGLALYATQYAPRWLKGTLVALIDLMAAVPSIIFGIWGLSEFEGHALFFSHWLNQYLGFIPLFHVNTDPNAATLSQSRYTASAFIAGLVVSLMVIPIAASVMRGVFDQAPAGEREAAYALGSTKWGVIRTVVLPFGRGGIIGGTMLGLGRALGETIAVLLIISDGSDYSFHILQANTRTISSLIGSKFGEATSGQLSALLAAGFVLFVMTLVVNTLAGIVVNRSRSGAGTDG